MKIWLKRKPAKESGRITSEEQSFVQTKSPVHTDLILELEHTSGTLSTMIADSHFGPLVQHNPIIAEVEYVNTFWVSYTHFPDHSIVLIHGLGGDRTLAWTKKLVAAGNNASYFWPSDLLPIDLPHARIVKWGYAANTIQPSDVVSIINLTQHAQRLCNELAHLRDGAGERPLVFVAHSMGGIVVKKAILLSKDSNQDVIRSITKTTFGVLFTGTPHKGSKHADIASSLLKIIKQFHQNNPSMVNALKTQDATLQELDQAFYQMLIIRHTADTLIEVRCFFETLPNSSIISVVVPSHSAAPPAYENSIAVDADHVGMTKSSGRDDQTYKNVLAELRRMIKLAKERKRGAGAEEKKEGATHIGNNDSGTLANSANQKYEGNTGESIHYGNNNTSN